MLKQNDGSFVLERNQPGAKSKFLAHLRLPFSFPRILPRLILVPLVCAAMFSMGTSRSWAAASPSPVPYRDSYVLQFVSQVDNNDGSRDQVYEGAGINTHGGIFNVVVQAHIEPDQFFEGYVLIEFTGSVTLTVANGDTLYSTLDGAEVVALPPSPPFPLRGPQTITGGTGRFSGATGSLTFNGLDHNDGTISINTSGTISTVGYNKTSD